MSDSIGARFVACKAWRWMPGMLVMWDPSTRPGGCMVEHTAARLVDYLPYGVNGSLAFDAVPAGRRVRPDTTDPATLGCILALVREAWGDPWLHLAPMIWTRMTKVWAVLDGEGDVVNVADMPLHGPTEAEALLAALESAP